MEKPSIEFPVTFLDSEVIKKHIGSNSNTVLSRLNELGITIHGSGKRKYIYTWELIQISKTEKNISVGKSYIGKGEGSKKLSQWDEES
ncbi:MAG: hypothetical protein AAF363_14365 [Bacteroidota bacterium]